MTKIQLLTFPVNTWSHLYSLQQAISRNDQLTGRKLTINSRVLNQPFLQHIDTLISIDFTQVDLAPDYPVLDSGLHEIGIMNFKENKLESNIKIDRSVFEELRKNLMEYADIEGIHIMITLGLLSNSEHWLSGEALQIVQLDYAMKGDS